MIGHDSKAERTRNTCEQTGSTSPKPCFTCFASTEWYVITTTVVSYILTTYNNVGNSDVQYYHYIDIIAYSCRKMILIGIV